MARGRWGVAAFAGAVLALALAGAAQARNPTAKGKQWALLIAGSNGYGNYRRQVRPGGGATAGGHLPCVPDHEQERHQG